MDCKIYWRIYNFYKKGLFVAIFSVLISLGKIDTLDAQIIQNVPIPGRWDYEVTLNKGLHTMHGLPKGPFVRLGKKQILTVKGTDALISEDNGQSWKPYPIFANPEDFQVQARAIQHTKDGIVILAFTNFAERHWTWNDKLEDAPGAYLPTYVVRSLDNGRTWEKPKMLHKDWTGSIRDMIITSDGNIVFTSMMLLHKPGHHSVVTYMSEDKGETWHRSNIIDLGGGGTHGGVMEGTLVELRDGRLMMLMRTNWMQFWRAESNDGGRTWHPIGPSGISASSAPGQLTRLDSGRLLLVWNRPYPEGESEYPLKGGNRHWSSVPTSNYRSELSIAFSEDEGETWSDPEVIARTAQKHEVSYPYIFEAEPGEIWVTTFRGPLRAKFYEKDFVTGVPN